MAIVRESALQTALMSVLIASQKGGGDLAALVDRALALTSTYPRDSGMGAAPSTASIELQKAYQAVMNSRSEFTEL